MTPSCSLNFTLINFSLYVAPFVYSYYFFFKFLSLADCSISLSALWSWRSARLRACLLFPFKLVPVYGLSFNRASRHTSSIYWLLLGSNQKRSCGFPFAANLSPRQPNLTLRCSQKPTNSNVYHCPTSAHNLTFTTQFILYHFISVLRLSSTSHFPKNQTFHEAHTDTFLGIYFSDVFEIQGKNGVFWSL